MKSEMLEAALAYAKAGYPVFPCAPLEKYPLTPNGVKAATTNEKKIREWWAKWGDANVAIHPGGANCMVVDYDIGANVEVIASKYHLPVTYMVAQTPSGGQHEWFCLPADVEVPPSASKIAPHADIRSHNSYVLVPPSRTKKGEYTWIEQGEAAPAPKSLIHAACSGKRKKEENSKEINVREDQEHNIEAYLAWIEKDAKPSIEGSGGNNNLAAAGAMGWSFALTPETTASFLWDFFNPVKCQPPWGDDEYEDFERTVMSGHRSASSSQGNMTEDYRRLKTKERVEATRKLFEDRRKQAEEAGDITTEQPNTSRFKVWTIPELKRREPPKWVIDTVIPEKGYSIIFGPPGTFKTFVALDIGLSVATDTPWHGKAVNRGRVLYCMGEGSFDADKRIEAWKKQHNAVTPVHDFKIIEPAPLLRLNQDTVAFMQTANQYGPWDLVIIDTIGRTMPGVNDSAAEGARLFSELVTAIRSELGAATLAITHSPKNQKHSLLGSGAFEADADTIFNAYCARDANEGIRINFTQTKQKYGEKWRDHLGFERVHHAGSLALKQCSPVADGVLKIEMTREIQAAYIVDALRSVAGKQWSVNGLAEEAIQRGSTESNATIRGWLGTGKPGWCYEHRELKKYWHRPSGKWRTPTILPDLDPAYDLSKKIGGKS